MTDNPVHRLRVLSAADFVAARGLWVKETRREDNRAIGVVLRDQVELEYNDSLPAAGADYFLSKANQTSELEQILQNEVSEHAKQSS